MSDELQVTCVCGWQTVGTEAEVIEATRAHGVELHNMDVTSEQVLAMSSPVQQADEEKGDD